MILLGDLKPGEFIKYDYLVGYSDICTGQGTITEITEKAIRVRKKSGHYDVLRIRDIERNETRILGLKPKKEENMGKQREIPNYTELRKAFQESGYKIAPVQREFKTHWDAARRWLFNAGLIDETNKPTEKAKENEPKQVFSKEEGKPVETAIESKDNTCAICGDATKAHERFWCEGKVVCYECQAALGVKAQIDAEPPDASPHEFNAGETGTTMPDNQAPVRDPAGSQYDPTDNDYQDDSEFKPGRRKKRQDDFDAYLGALIDNYVDDDDEPTPYVLCEPTVNEFDRKAFVLLMIEAILENSRNFKAPAELTVELIDAILVVAL